MRIGGGVYPDHVSERDYLSDKGEYTIGPDVSPKMRDSLMYRLSYYDFGKVRARVEEEGWMWMVMCVFGASSCSKRAEVQSCLWSGNLNLEPAGPPLLQTQQRSRQIMTQQGQQPGYDRVRATDIGLKDYELKYLDEAFTSEHWIGAPA